MFHRYFCVAGINDSFVPGERRFKKVCKLKCSKVEKLEKPIWFLNVKRGHRRQRVDSLDDKLWLKSLHDCFPLRAIHLMFQYLQNFFLQLPPDFMCGRVENHFCEKVFQLVAARLRSVSRMQGTFNLRTQSFHFTYKRLLPSQVYFCVDMVRSFFINLSVGQSRNHRNDFMNWSRLILTKLTKTKEKNDLGRENLVCCHANKSAVTNISISGGPNS